MFLIRGSLFPQSSQLPSPMGNFAGLLVTYIDRQSLSERKLIMSHFSIFNVSCDDDSEATTTATQSTISHSLSVIKQFLFTHDPCAEISIALLTYEKEKIMFGVHEQMEALMKSNNFVQVEFQDDYDSQLYCTQKPTHSLSLKHLIFLSDFKRPEDIPKRKLM